MKKIFLSLVMVLFIGLFSVSNATSGRYEVLKGIILTKNEIQKEFKNGDIYLNKINKILSNYKNDKTKLGKLKYKLLIIKEKYKYKYDIKSKKIKLLLKYILLKIDWYLIKLDDSFKKQESTINNSVHIIKKINNESKKNIITKNSGGGGSKIELPKNCTKGIKHGESKIFYKTGTVPYGKKCESEVRTCTNGKLSGSYSYSSCKEEQVKSCNISGITLKNGESRYFYSVASVKYGESCLTKREKRTCNNGVLSGNYTNLSCKEELPKNCTKGIKHGENKIFYKTGTVPYGRKCESEVRTCTNGKLSGSYSYYTCEVLSKTKKIKSLSVFIAGQSFADFLVKKDAKKVFEKVLNEGFPNSYVNGYSMGGSAAVHTHAGYWIPDRWWYDTDIGEYGPMLKKAIDKIKNSKKIYNTIIWMQGTADSIWDLKNASKQSELDKYYKATREIIWRLKKAANPSDPNSVRVMMLSIPRRLCIDAPGVQAIRETQFKIIKSSPSIFILPGLYDLKTIGEQTSDTKRKCNIHFNQAQEFEYAKRAALAVRWLYGDKSAKKAPVVTDIFKYSDNEIKVKISSQSLITEPLKPSGFAVRESNGVTHYNDLSFKWKDGYLIIKVNKKLKGKVDILYPYGEGKDYDLKSIIRDSDYLPLTPFKKSMIF